MQHRFTCSLADDIPSGPTTICHDWQTTMLQWRRRLLLYPQGLRLEWIMNRRELGLVVAMAASLVVTAGTGAFAQGGSAAAAASDSAVGPTVTAPSAVAPSPGGAAAQAASDQAVSAPASGATPSCAVPSAAALPTGTGKLASAAPSVGSSLAQGGEQLRAAGGC